MSQSFFKKAKILFLDCRIFRQDQASFRTIIKASNYQQTVMQELLFLVTPYIRKQNTVMREAIPPWKRLSATLRFLATGNSFQDLAFSTRIAPNTLSQIVPETLQAIITQCLKTK